MKIIKYLFYLVFALIFMSFTRQPTDLTGKYMSDMSDWPKIRPLLYNKLDVRTDSTFTYIHRNDVNKVVYSGTWACVGDTLTTFEIIDPRELPSNELDSIFFDWGRSYIHKYYIVNRDTLIQMYDGRNGARFLRVTDDEFDKYNM